MVITPEGRLSRYLYGIAYPPATVRLALVEASQGRIGSTIDRILLFCFHYDAASGSYAPTALRIVQLGGTVTLITLLMGPGSILAATSAAAGPRPGRTPPLLRLDLLFVCWA